MARLGLGRKREEEEQARAAVAADPVTEGRDYAKNVAAAKQATKTAVVAEHPTNPFEQTKKKSDAQIVADYDAEMAARDGMQPGNAKHDLGYNDITIDFSTIKDNEQAAYIASTMYGEKARQAVLKDWASYSGQDEDAVLYGAEELLGTRLFSSPVSKAGQAKAVRNEAMQTLSGLNLMGFDGQAINVSTADAATVVRGINAIADSDERAKAAKAYKTLTETEGSRFYGQNTDGVGAFLESANLTLSDYKDQVSAYKELFYGDGAHDKEDAAAYLKARQAIENEDVSAYTQNQLLSALDKVYMGVTGKDAPKAEDAQTEEDKQPDEKKPSFWESLFGQKSDEPPKEKKPGFFAGLTGQIPEAEKTSQTEGQHAPQDAPEASAAQAASQAAPGMSPRQIEEQIVAQGGMSFADWRASGMPNALPSVQSEEQAQEESAPKAQAATIGEAAQALMSGRYDEIEGEGKDELNRMLAGSGYARQMIGTLTAEDSAEIALNNRPAENIAYASIASQGQTIKTLYDAMKSDSFPAELRGGVMAQMVAWASQAEKMEQAGTLGGDAALPLMERLLTTDEQAMSELESIYEARDELLSDRVEMRREQEQQSAQSLSDARQAALRGAASEEQLALVRQNADVSEAMIWRDSRYQQRKQEVFAYFEPDWDGESGFTQSTVKKSLDAQGVLDTSDYEGALYEQMNVLLEEDTKTALALGMSLEDYYAQTGGVDMNALCERAASRISRQGEAVTDEDAQAMEAPFGEGVGTGYMIGAGLRDGGKQWYLDFRDSLYVGMSQYMVTRNAARLQDRYQNDYGAYGRTQYRHDIEAALDSGTLDENYAQALQTALGSAADVYQLGVDPRDFEGDFLKNSAEIRQDIATMETYMRENATEDEFRWFGRVKSMAYNGVSAAAATAATMATGNSFAGFTTGYSVVGFKNHFDEYLQKGYSINSAKQMAAVNTGTDAMANVGTYEAILGGLTGMSALTEAAKNTIIRNPAGAMKGLSAVRAFGESAVKAFVEGEADEIIFDEFKEGLGGNWVENGLGEIYRRIDAGEDVRFTDGLKLTLNLLNPKNLDVAGAAKGVTENAVENAIGAVVFSLSGAIGSGVGSLKGVRAAQDLMSGKRTDVEGVLTEIRETLGDEQAAALLDRYAEQQKEAKAVAEEIVSGKSQNGSAEQAAKAKQQAEDAQTAADAAQTAADSSRAQFEDAAQAVSDGDLTRQKEMAQARVREGENQKIANEQGAVAERRKAEMEQAQAKRLEEARQAARQKQQAEDAAGREAIAQDRTARMAAIDEDMAALEQQEKAAEEAFYAAAESYTQALDMGLDEDTLAQLDARMGEIGEKLIALYEKKEALQNPEVYAARKQAEAAQAEAEKQAQAQTERFYEREQVKQELDEISPALRDVVGSSAKRIYLNDQQLGEILHATGLRNISQVNREYGTKFRIGKKSADTDLDSGFFAELAARIPERADAQSGHPEEEVMRLIERQRELQGKLGELDMQASVGKGGAEAYLSENVSRGNLDPVTQKLASHLKQKTGLDLIVTPLGDKVRGFYDRANGRLILSNRLGAGEQMRQVVMHELTHFIEGTQTYDAYEDAALYAAYRGDMDAMERDTAELRKTYEDAGIQLKPGEASRELVAAATEKLMDSLGAWGKTGSETLVYDLLGQKQSFPVRVYNKLTQFLARRKAEKAGGAAVDHYKALVDARDKLRSAIAEAGTWKKGEGSADKTIELFGKTAPVEREVTQGEQTEMDVQYAVGLRQFGNKTAQKMDTLTDATKDFLRGSEYEKVVNREQVQRANDDINARGIDAVVDDLIVRKDWTADDHVKAAVALVRAENEGYATTAWVIAEAYNKQGTNAGQALQARKIAKKLTASGALVEATKKADHANEKKGVLHGDLPVGDQKGVKGKKERKVRNPDVKTGTETKTGKTEETGKPGTETKTGKTEETGKPGTDAPGGKTAETDTNTGTQGAKMGQGEGEGGGRVRLNPKDDPKQDSFLEDEPIDPNLTPSGEYDPNNPFNKGRTSVLAQEDVEGARGAAGDAVQGSFIESRMPPVLEETYSAAERMQRQIDKLPGNVSADNPWNLPMADWKMELIDQYRLRGVGLPGDTYSYATVKERMLAAILASRDDADSGRRLGLCQQLEAMKRGLAVVTEADLNYITGQMSTFLYAEGADLEGMPVTTEGKTALQRVYNAQANTVQDGTLEKINAFGYTNMLSSTKTWSKNITSNLLIRPLELASEKVGGFIERKMITPKTGNRTTDAPNRAERAAGADAFTGEIGQTCVDYFVTHVDTGHGSSFDLNHNNRTYSNAFLQAYKNIVDFAMQIGDRPYWEQCYAEELAVIKRLGTKIEDTRTENGREVRGLREMTLEEMKNEAAVRATERVFQEDNGIVNGINKARQESPMLDLAITSLMPFLKTPTNVAGRMMQYSPVGLARTLIQYGLWDGKRDGGKNFDQRKFVMNLGRGLTGTGLATAGALLAGIGAIQPGREDEDDKRRAAIRKAQGESYSTYIKLGDMEIPLDFAQPASGPLYIGAKIAWELQNMGEDRSAANFAWNVLYGSALETGNQLFDNSFLSGMSELFKGYSDVEGIMSNIAGNIAENQASRLTPSMIRAFAKATDPYVRDTYSQNAFRQFLNQQILQNWPILRQTLPIKTDVTGDRTLQNGYNGWGQEHENAALHFLNSFLTPWTAAGEKGDAALDELTDLSYRTGDTSFLPGDLISSTKYEATITKTMAKELKVGKVGFNQYESFKIHLTDEEKRWVNSSYADMLFSGNGKDVQGIRALLSSAKWARMTDEAKMEAVKEAQSKAKKAVLTELVRRKKESGEIR